MKFLTFCVAVEVAGVAAVGTGIGIELSTHADFGYMVISFGSLVITSGGIIFAKFLRRGKGC